MKQVSVIGAGTMGACIAQVFAMNGYSVVLADRAMEFVKKGYKIIEGNLGKLERKEKISAAQKMECLAQIHLTERIADCAGSFLTIEAVSEILEVKQEIFQELETVLGEDAILATNTSSISITQIGSVLKKKERFAGMHFFNPAHIMKLVEVIGGMDTEDQTIEKICTVAEELGKTPVRVNESAGFVVNRLLIPMINEAVGILAEGVARREAIDLAMQLGASHPMGPLALADLIGNDVVLAIMEVLHTETGDSKYRAHPHLKKMVRAGLLGKKAGKGFYDYSK